VSVSLVDRKVLLKEEVLQSSGAHFSSVESTVTVSTMTVSSSRMEMVALVMLTASNDY
jgi:hypothetical protein